MPKRGVLDNLRPFRGQEGERARPLPRLEESPVPPWTMGKRYSFKKGGPGKWGIDRSFAHGKGKVLHYILARGGHYLSKGTRPFEGRNKKVIITSWCDESE